MKARKAKMKKINAHKPKNWKIDLATALINSLYISLKNRPFLATCAGGPTGKAATRRNAIKHGPRPSKAIFQGAILNVPQEEMLLNMDCKLWSTYCQFYIDCFLWPSLCEGHKAQKATPSEGPNGRGEQKDAPPEGPKRHEEPKDTQN